MDSLEKFISVQEATVLRSAFEIFQTKIPKSEGGKVLDRISQ